MTMAVAQVVGCTIESNLGPGVLVRSSPSPVEVGVPSRPLTDCKRSGHESLQTSVIG